MNIEESKAQTFSYIIIIPQEETSQILSSAIDRQKKYLNEEQQCLISIPEENVVINYRYTENNNGKAGTYITIPRDFIETIKQYQKSCLEREKEKIC